MKKIVFWLFLALVGYQEMKAQKIDTKNDKPAQMGKAGLNNAGKAKPPKGVLSFKANNVYYESSENTTQCMYIGMGDPNYAQGMIMGKGKSFLVSGIMMNAAKIGTYKGKNFASTVGMSITIDNKEYTNLPGEIVIIVDKISQDGNNHYIGGAFSGKFRAKDGSTISVADGKYKSGYL